MERHLVLQTPLVAYVEHLGFGSDNYAGTEPFQLRLNFFVLQIIITVGHMTRTYLDTNAYNSILAVQCVLLFIKVQYFARYSTDSVRC